MSKLLVILLAIPTLAFAGIANTKHNLSTSGSGVNKLTAGTDQICVFCHTPHASDTTAAVPLWNKKLDATGFQTYNSISTSATSSIDGQILPVGSVSLACLSCLDGVQAMDNMINAPGSGGYNAAGAPLSGATWTGANQSGGVLGTGIVSNIGKDLTNDHPIGIEYCGGGVTGSGTSVSGSCNDSDFKSGATELMTAQINGRQVFWVETGGAGRQKTDISLYTRAFTGSVDRPSVECASCHDPHVEAKGSDNIMFMRVTTAGSAICLACHVK